MFIHELAFSCIVIVGRASPFHYRSFRKFLSILFLRLFFQIFNHGTDSWRPFSDRAFINHLYLVGNKRLSTWPQRILYRLLCLAWAKAGQGCQAGQAQDLVWRWGMLSRRRSKSEKSSMARKNRSAMVRVLGARQQNQKGKFMDVGNTGHGSGKGHGHRGATSLRRRV